MVAAPDMSWRRAGAVLAAWTLLTWTTRVPLLWGDDGLTAGEKLVATAPVVVFVALGGAVVAGLVVRRAWAAPVALGLAAWSLAFWAVRVPQIALADHPAGFVVVHVVLGTVAAGLSAWVVGVRAGARRRDRSSVRPTGDVPVGRA